MKKNPIVKTRTQIAEEYGISRKTFYNWCKEAKLELPKERALNPIYQKLIYDTFGKPKIAKAPPYRH